jgi:peptidoglycan hydrolase-like protein with peptidoglycan-binding domain
MSHNRSHIIIRMAVATAIASMGLIALPGIANAATAQSANITAKTAPGQPKFGEKGAHVVAVQTAIIRNGFTLKGGATGVFDNTTLKALKSFQKVVGLKVTGVVDTDTARVLKVAEATTTTVAPTTTVAAPTTTVASVKYPFTAATLPVRGNKGDNVRLVQSALVAAGIEIKGGVDGVFGGATFVALQKFQTANGLAITGALDTVTAIKLGVMAPPAIQLSVFPVQGVCSFENTWHAPRGGG